jgi:CIC family chloride channel protein
VSDSIPSPGGSSPPDELAHWTSKLQELRHLTLVAVPVGVLAGVGVSALEALCNRLLWAHFVTAAPVLRLVFPVVGLLLSGLILRILKVRSVGMLNEVVVHYHATPDTLSVRDDALKAAACVATVGFGASAGLGGPSQWLGARIGQYLVRLGRMRFPSLRDLTDQHALLIGAASGVSAIFRAPLTGTLLALETPFSKDIDATALLPASIGALIAHFVHGLLLDNTPLLPFPTEAAVDGSALLASAAIGVAAGVTSRAFQRVMIWTRRASTRLSWSASALTGGLVTAATALVALKFFGDTWTLQAGLPMSQAVFAAQFVGTAALSLLALKLVSVWATFGTSGVAGLLVVTLTVGSLIGASLAPAFPELSPSQACAIAVCAYLAANYNAPLTGVALAAEWGGTGLLKDAWIAVLIAAWIGEGLANTPAKKGTRHLGTIHHH